MPTLSLLDLKKAFQPITIKNISSKLYTNGFCIDSRRVENNSLFFAFKGERVDGHDFVKDALNRGAIAAVVERDIGDHPLLIVEDIEKALISGGELARSKLSCSVIGITGSSGKTSTKEICATLLNNYGKTYATQGNLNNLLGVPITLSKVPDNTDFAVIEMGMNAKGEIDTLARISKPDVGIITNIGPVHLEGLGSIQGVRQAKSELIPYVKIIILPFWEKELIALAKSQNKEIITFGMDEGIVSIVKKSIKIDGYGIHATIKTPYDTLQAVFPVPSSAYLFNIAAAISGLMGLGIQIKDLSSLKDIELPSGRMEIFRHKKYIIIFDGYNANPLSFEAAFNTVDTFSAYRKIGIFGDMLELGDESEALHAQVANKAKGFDHIFYVGKYFEAFKKGLPKGISCSYHKNAIQAGKALLMELRQGDLILIKGSRGIHLEQSLDIIKESLNMEV